MSERKASMGPETAVGRKLAESGRTLAVAESCTGGLVGHMITNVPGSSAYFKGGVVAYGNEAKKRLLGVSAATLDRHGAVSAQTASKMAEGARKKLGADMALAITGIAGPGGGTPDKPVGTVFVAIADCRKVRTKTKKLSLKGTRKAIKKAAALSALNLLEKALA
ncbi:MAG: nicotinamide-nucleotide amidohydrolase family protein [Thermodesulfobacteriota bacterium]